MHSEYSAASLPFPNDQISYSSLLSSESAFEVFLIVSEVPPILSLRLFHNFLRIRESFSQPPEPFPLPAWITHRVLSTGLPDPAALYSPVPHAPSHAECLIHFPSAQYTDLFLFLSALPESASRSVSGRSVRRSFFVLLILHEEALRNLPARSWQSV